MQLHAVQTITGTVCTDMLRAHRVCVLHQEIRSGREIQKHSINGMKEGQGLYYGKVNVGNFR